MLLSGLASSVSSSKKAGFMIVMNGGVSPGVVIFVGLTTHCLSGETGHQMQNFSALRENLWVEM